MSPFKLRPYQELFVSRTLEKFRDHRRLLAVMPTGCHVPGHPIMMADGSIQSVERVKVGDIIMGPDSRPRHVLKLHQGSDEMYRIIPKKGDPFIVNGGHILHLRRTLTGKARDDRHPPVAHISVDEWLQKTKTFRSLYMLEQLLEGHPKEDAHLIGFEVEAVGPGEYFGFTLDGDHLYVDGHFLIHHNSGKTVCFSEAAKRIHPVRTLILAHREELLVQAQDKLFRSTGLAAQIEKAEHRASHQADVVVGSVQSLMRDKRLQRWPRDHFGLVVVDEAHHALADSYQKVLRHFDSHAKVLGVTATPDRGDKRNLGEYFEDIAYEVSLHELIKEQYLSPISVRTVPININLGGVRTTAGDYNDADLGNAIEPFLEAIVGELRAAIGNRKTIVFLPLVRTSKKFVELCQRVGLSAAHIDGSSSDRGEILQSFADGEFQILCNSMLLTEGFDEPSVECVICLRPTQMRALYSQIIGRGTRIHPGKQNLLVLDFLWMTEKHSLVRPAHLVAPSAEIASEMTAMSEARAGEELEQDLMEMAADAKEARERKLAEELEANARRKSRCIDPIEFALSLHEVDLADWAPTMRWHEESPSDKQLRTLTQFGFDPKAVPSKGYASVLLDRIFSRRDLDLATPKQLHWLRKTGHPKPDLATFREAKTWLDEQFNRRAS